MGITEKLGNQTAEQLKDTLDVAIQAKKTAIIRQQIKDLKEYKEYNDIMEIFDDIKANKLYDAPLMLEWNTWRAMNSGCL